jgi:hypothetical protein
MNRILLSLCLIFVGCSCIGQTKKDSFLLHRYGDSVSRYENICWSYEPESEEWQEAKYVADYYLRLFNKIYKKYEKPLRPLPRPKDSNIYPPKP